jgi:hypothetical protein
MAYGWPKWVCVSPRGWNSSPVIPPGFSTCRCGVCKIAPRRRRERAFASEATSRGLQTKRVMSGNDHEAVKAVLNVDSCPWSDG